MYSSALCLTEICQPRQIDRRQRCVVAVVLLLAAVPAAGQEARRQPIPVQLESMQTLKVTTSGRGLEHSVRAVQGSGCTPQVSTHTDADFTGGAYTAQGGFAEGEIAAASYTIDPGAFPIRIDAMEMIFATMNASEQTTTQWTVLVWEGTPSTGNLVFQASSDGDLLPHIVLPPGTNGVNVLVMVDPEDPDQIIVNDIGSATFSIGYRIDVHNQQTQDPCFFAPPSCCNAFPTTDLSGVASQTGNWLFGVNCGPLGCPSNGGWATFLELPGSPGTLCTPSGDWVMRATWSPFTCLGEAGACCLEDASCFDGLTMDDCDALAGEFQGQGSNCGTPCPEPVVACCFGAGCLDFAESDCDQAGGVSQGPGSQCAGNDCPIGACCLEDGSCFDGESGETCSAAGGTYQGHGTDCEQANCPLPDGACCFDSGFCSEITEAECMVAGAEWQGPQTTCDSNPCEAFGACCFDTGFCSIEFESNCNNVGATFMGDATDCADDNGDGTADACCPADVNGDGEVSIEDLLTLLAQWGTVGPEADVDGNGEVEVEDLLILLAAWGPC